jgi:hypothetical protein
MLFNSPFRARVGTKLPVWSSRSPCRYSNASHRAARARPFWRGEAYSSRNGEKGAGRDPRAFFSRAETMRRSRAAFVAFGCIGGARPRVCITYASIPRCRSQTRSRIATVARYAIAATPNTDPPRLKYRRNRFARCYGRTRAFKLPNPRDPARKRDGA